MSKVPFPQFDRRPDVSGGADAWDDGPGGKLLIDDYMTAASLPTLYIGANWGTYRVGSTADATLYLGTIALRP